PAALPCKSESGEVFAQAIGVVGDFALFARDAKEAAAGFAEVLAGAADADDAGELGAVEEVEVGGAAWTEDLLEQGLVGIGRGGALPGVAEPVDFGFQNGAGNSSTGSECRHACDGGVQ